MISKVCTSCKEEKLLEDFHRDKRVKSGRTAICKECSNKKRKKWYNDNKEYSKQKSRKYYKNKIKKLYDYLLEHPCKCGESDPVCLEFDHVNPEEKEIAICEAIRIWSWERVLKEIDKCVVLCKNCHAKRTANQQGWYNFIDEDDRK